MTIQARTLGAVQAELRLTTSQLGKLTTNPAAQWRKETRPIGGKRRTLHLASALLRHAQKRLLKGPLASVPVHPASFCEKGRGCVAAARLHAGHPVLLHLDLKGFFPSVSAERVKTGLTSVGFTPEAADLIARLTTTDDCLPQGACTSVAIGNLVLGRLDGRLAELCRLRGLTYTRYVDDIGVSGGKRLASAERLIRGIIADEGWTVGTKGGLLGQDTRHRYLGIILNASPNLSDNYLKDLRFVIRFLAKRPSLATTRVVLRLRSRVRWVALVNPEAGQRLEKLIAEAPIT